MNNKISFTRGDTQAYKFQRRNSDGTPIAWIPDEMYITFKKDEYTDSIIWQKKLTTKDITYDSSNHYYSFQIEAEDTQDLSYGDYVLDITYKKASTIKTIFTCDVTILKEVTFRSNM